MSKVLENRIANLEAARKSRPVGWVWINALDKQVNVITSGLHHQKQTFPSSLACFQYVEKVINGKENVGGLIGFDLLNLLPEEFSEAIKRITGSSTLPFTIGLNAVELSNKPINLELWMLTKWMSGAFNTVGFHQRFSAAKETEKDKAMFSALFLVYLWVRRMEDPNTVLAGYISLFYQAGNLPFPEVESQRKH